MITETVGRDYTVIIQNLYSFYTQKKVQETVSRKLLYVYVC